MGCPDRHYKIALQNFAYVLTCMKNKRLADRWREEDSEELLKEYTLSKKKVVSTDRYYYDAGIAIQQMMDEAVEEGCDSMNATLGGMIMFEDFLGLRDNGD